MKFSEYIVLGSTFLNFDPTSYLEEGSGCFIGMATAAKTGITHFDQQIFSESFPWVWEKRRVFCPFCYSVGSRFAFSISCLSAHVGLGEISFEKGLDYVRMIEPVEGNKEKTAYGLMVPTIVRKHG